MELGHPKIGTRTHQVDGHHPTGWHESQADEDGEHMAGAEAAHFLVSNMNFRNKHGEET